MVFAGAGVGTCLEVGETHTTARAKRHFCAEREEG